MESKANKKYEKMPRHIEDTASSAVDSAFHVHRNLGAGLIERIYERFMEIELNRRGRTVKRQVKLPIKYEEVEYDEYYTMLINFNDTNIGNGITRVIN